MIYINESASDGITRVTINIHPNGDLTISKGSKKESITLDSLNDMIASLQKKAIKTGKDNKKLYNQIVSTLKPLMGIYYQTLADNETIDISIDTEPENMKFSILFDNDMGLEFTIEPDGVISMYDSVDEDTKKFYSADTVKKYIIATIDDNGFVMKNNNKK